VAKEGLLLAQTNVPIEAKAATLHAVAVEPAEWHNLLMSHLYLRGRSFVEP
jgi:hypothetical protein